MSKLLQQYQSFKQNPSSGAFSFLIAAKKELYDEMTRVAEQAGEKFVKTVIEKARRNAEKEFESYKEITLKAMEKELNTLNELAYEIKTNTMKGDKGEDGKDADEEKIFKKLMGKMPIVKDGKDADEERITREILKKTKKEIQNEIMNFFLRNPKKEMTEEDIAKIAKGFSFIFDPKQWAEEIARAMEGLPMEKKLDYDSGLRNKPSVPVYKDKIGGRMGRGTGSVVKAYDISSILDGVTKTFTIPTNNRVISVHSSSFPFNFRPTTDFTNTSNTITFTAEIDASSTLASGQTITIIYSEI